MSEPLEVNGHRYGKDFAYKCITFYEAVLEKMGSTQVDPGLSFITSPAERELVEESLVPEKQNGKMRLYTNYKGTKFEAVFEGGELKEIKSGLESLYFKKGEEADHFERLRKEWAERYG